MLSGLVPVACEVKRAGVPLESRARIGHHRVRKLSKGMSPTLRRKFRCNKPCSEPRSPQLSKAFDSHINTGRSGKSEALEGKITTKPTKDN